MCDINGPFHLCTCESAVDRSKPHWVLHRNLQSKEEYQVVGLFSNLDPYDLVSSSSLKRRLNTTNVFDFEYEPVEGDFLELFLEPEWEEGFELRPNLELEFTKGKWRLLEDYESNMYKHSMTQMGEMIGPKTELTIAYEHFKANASKDKLQEFEFHSEFQGVTPALRTKKGLLAYFKNIFSFLLIATFLFACDLKPIDYSKKTRKSSYARSSTTQTGQRRKAHARMGVSSSKRAFKNRINSRSYYNRNKHRRKLRKGD
jgi:hypothetical protein